MRGVPSTSTAAALRLLFNNVIIVKDGRPTTTTAAPTTMLADLVGGHHAHGSGSNVTRKPTETVRNIVALMLVAATQDLCSADAENSTGHQVAGMAFPVILVLFGLVYIHGAVVTAVWVIVPVAGCRNRASPSLLIDDFWRVVAWDAVVLNSDWTGRVPVVAVSAALSVDVTHGI